MLANSSSMEVSYHSVFRSPSLLVVAIFTIAMWVLVNLFKQHFSPASGPNPPIVFHWVPIIGSAISYGNDPLRFLQKCREKYGDIFTFILFGKKVTVALGPHGNNFIMGGSTAVFNAEDAYTNLTTPIFGKDVAYDAPSHIFIEQKKFLKYGLTHENFRKYVGLVEEETQMYLNSRHPFDKSLDSSDGDTWRTFDPLHVMEEVTILTAARTLLGKEVRANLDTSFSALYNDLDAGFIPINLLLPNLPLPVNRRRDRAHRSISRFFIDIIHRRKFQASTQEPDHDMIASLMGRTYKDGRALQDHEVAHMLIGLLMAGQHTSSSTAAWILLHLAANPVLAELLFAEQLKSFTTGEGTFRSMTYDELRGLPVMNAVINETLRMHPPIHSILRNVRKDVPVPQKISSNSYVIPHGHYVLASPFVGQMDGQHWEEPEVWSPYRWLEPIRGQPGAETDQNPSWKFAEECNSKATDSIFQPFGSGRHRCIGEQFAHLQLGTIIATIIRQFELYSQAGVPDANYQTMIICPKKPRTIFYRRRQIG